MLGIRWDHPHRRIEIKFFTVAGLQEVVLRFEFYQNWLSGFGALRGRNLRFPIDLAIFPQTWPNQWQTANFDPPTAPKPLNCAMLLDPVWLMLQILRKMLLKLCLTFIVPFWAHMRNPITNICNWQDLIQQSQQSSVGTDHVHCTQPWYTILHVTQFHSTSTEAR